MMELHMFVVIIAGGSGTRLWPLSTPSFPKHLLKLTNDHSLLQNTLNRARKLTTDKKIFVIPDKSHCEHVVSQLKDFERRQIICEPDRRGTASCVLLAMQQLKARGAKINEPVAFLWADHLIRDEKGFTNTFKWAGQLARKHNKVVFIGAEPTYAATGFGYMEHGDQYDGEARVYDLLKFQEKPNQSTAEKYYRSGKFFWNMGYLVMNIAAFEAAAQKFAKPFWRRYVKLSKSNNVMETYLGLENEAVDYAFSEKIKGAVVIPGGFDWTDVGSFRDLHGISSVDGQGNHIRGKTVAVESVTNSYIRNETDVAVAVIGIDNVIVVNTPNGVLVTNKNFAQLVGDVSKRLQ